MTTKPKINPCEELGMMAEDNGDYEEIKELIETYGVQRATPPVGKTGEIYVYDLEQALLRIPPHRYDAKIGVLALLLSYNLSKGTITQALNRAVAKSQYNSVRLLLDNGANPNHLDEAAAAGDLDAIDTLIAAGANISHATKAVSLATLNGRTKTLQILLDLGFPCDLRTIGYNALLSNNPSTIDAVCKAGVQFTEDYMQDEDIQMCPKSIEYLANLFSQNKKN